MDSGECLPLPSPAPPKKARVEIEVDGFEEGSYKFEEEFKRSGAMDSGECLTLPSPAPPKKARVEIEVDEFEEGSVKSEEEFTKTEDRDSEFEEFDETYYKFKQELRKSEGFDIQTFPDKVYVGMIKVLFDLKHIRELPPQVFDTFLGYKFGCIFSLKYAIFKENQKKNKNLTFEKIIKSNFQAGDVFYTTFLAKDEYTGESKIYQTKVWSSSIHGETEVFIFRDRADQALQPGEDTQGVDAEVFPNLPAPGAFKPLNLDIYAWGEDAFYLTLCYASTRSVLREKNRRENQDWWLEEITESSYGADFSFRTTFKVEDVRRKEYKTYQIEVFFNMKNGEVELQKFTERS